MTPLTICLPWQPCSRVMIGSRLLPNYFSCHLGLSGELFRLEASQRRQITESHGQSPSPLLHSHTTPLWPRQDTKNGMAVGLIPKVFLIPKVKVSWNSHRSDARCGPCFLSRELGLLLLSTDTSPLEGTMTNYSSFL